MYRRTLLSAIFACLLFGSASGYAQEKGTWRAASKTAESITGDIVFSGEKISINFSGFTVAQIRTLNADELKAAFNVDPGAGGMGNLYRVEIPAAKRFLHHNTLCGSEDTEWIATYVQGRELQLAFLSGLKMPVFTTDALANSANLCGTYSYSR